MKRILAVVAACVLTGCTTTTHIRSELARLTHSDSLASVGVGRVFDSTGRFHGSCFAIQGGLVVTAYHVLVGVDGDIFIEGVPAEVVRLDRKTDLALLRARGHPLRELRLRDAVLGEDSWSAGYVGVDLRIEESAPTLPSQGGVRSHPPLPRRGSAPTLPSQGGGAQRGVTSSGATVSRGSVSSLNASSWIQHDGGVQPGMSGGPLIGADGAVLGCLSHCVPWGNSALGEFSVNTTMARYSRSAWIAELASDVRDSDPALPPPLTLASGAAR